MSKSFNYAALDAADRAPVREHTKQIHALLDRTAQAAVEIGRRLIEVRERVGSKFAAWLRAEFQWSQALSSYYMSIAQKFGDLDVLPRFQVTALRELARENTDPRAVEAAITAARNGETITNKTACALIRQFATPAAPAPRHATLIGLKSNLRLFRDRFHDIIGGIGADEIAALADDLLRLAAQLRTAAIPAAPADAKKPRQPRKAPPRPAA